MIQASLPQENPKPIAVLGAGRLISHVYRDAQHEYAFNLFRLNAQLETSQAFAVNDLRDIIKLCQVLSFAICDDGWLSTEEREQLQELNQKLDDITQDWSERRHG